MNRTYAVEAYLRAHPGWHSTRDITRGLAPTTLRPMSDHQVVRHLRRLHEAGHIEASMQPRQVGRGQVVCLAVWRSREA